MLGRCRFPKPTISRRILTCDGARRYSSPAIRPGASQNDQARVIFSGIQPTGVPHLGNYLGALREWVKLQNESKDKPTLIYSLVDLHAITVRQDPEQLREWKQQSLAMLMAIGLDPKRCIIFHQSDVAAHTELMWILSCQASTGYLGRMTQWKEKTANDRSNSERLKVGLFSYPILQAADVLVHGATHVPVGHDQAQHLELTRELANSFNAVYGEGKRLLYPPQTVISPAKRIMSLTEPVNKMSKSHANEKSRILLTDASDVIASKIKGAVTDSTEGINYDPQLRPGVSNLLEILYHTADDRRYNSPIDVAKDFANSSLRNLKEAVIAAVDSMLLPIRERYLQTISDTQLLLDTAASGAERASANAMPRLLAVRNAVGIS